MNRIAGSARLAGRFVDITSAETVACLHPLFRGEALAYNLKDFDGAALKNAENRLLTQEVSQYPWTRKNPDGSDYCDGIQFRSRHGDDLLTWAIFERGTDGQAIAYAVRSASCRGFLNACFYPGAGAGDASERHIFVSFAANENGPAPLKAGVVYILPSRSFTRMPSYTDPILGLITECQFVSTEPVPVMAEISVQPANMPLTPLLHDFETVSSRASLNPLGFPWLH